MTNDLDLKTKISQVGDEDLLRMVTINYADYRAEALKFASEELNRRGIAFTPPPTLLPEPESKGARWIPLVGILVAMAIMFALYQKIYNPTNSWTPIIYNIIFYIVVLIFILPIFRKK